MKRSTILPIAYLLLITLLFLGCEDKDTIVLQSGGQQNVMRVVGSGSVTAPPDIAIAQIGVQTISTELDPAITENNKKMEAIISVLRQQGVSDKDIKTISFNVYPLRDYKNNDPNKIVGYQVDNTLSVTFRKIDGIGKGLQSAIDAGANNIMGVYFTISDTESLKNDARIKAIEDAKKKASSMAQAAGINLGKIISINETSSGIPISRVDYSKGVAEGAVPIQEGQLELTVQVEIVYEIP